jgi:hypothetical protein
MRSLVNSSYIPITDRTILVVPTRIELVMVDYQSTVIPFNYRTLVVPVGIEPTSSALQAAAMTTFAKAPIIVPLLYKLLLHHCHNLDSLQMLANLPIYHLLIHHEYDHTLRIDRLSYFLLLKIFGVSNGYRPRTYSFTESNATTTL